MGGVYLHIRLGLPRWKVEKSDKRKVNITFVSHRREMVLRTVYSVVNTVIEIRSFNPNFVFALVDCDIFRDIKKIRLYIKPIA